MKVSFCKILRCILAALILLPAMSASAYPGMKMSKLRVQGRYFVDEDGKVVNMHGFAQTFSPWFNEMGTQWGDYSVKNCLKYNKGKIDQIMDAGWKMTFVRQHMDPYWSNTPGVGTQGEHDISAFSFDRFVKYLDLVFVPMAEYAIEKGLYVVMRPPGVCPEVIAVGDAYHNYLKKVWTQVAKHPSLKNNPYIMFELANEPVRIKNGANSTCTDWWTDAGHKQMTLFFQEIVDAMRAEGCENILLIPGGCWQQEYSGFAKYPVKGDNIGYAVHCYPGWFGSEGTNGDGGNADGKNFRQNWNNQFKDLKAPLVVTEMDWVPDYYGTSQNPRPYSWGIGYTGEAGVRGFGANFKKIADECGNVSWLIFTGQEFLAQFRDPKPSNPSLPFLYDPEACVWSSYYWYKEYAEASGIKDVTVEEADEDPIVDVYSISGVLVKKQVRRSDAVNTLPRGFYIVGNKKMLIK